MVDPAARKSSSRDTQMRVPRMQGFPKQTAGSTEIRDKRGFIEIRCPSSSHFPSTDNQER